MMKKGLLLVFLFLAASVFAQTVKIAISTDIQMRNGKKYYVHTVQKGQTLYSIARAYHVGLDEIYYANPETRQGIRVGQKIWIPVVNRETEINRQIKNSQFDFFYHVAAAGETIDHIASIYLIPKKYILLANPGIKSPLKEGEYVKIPVESAFPYLDGKVSGKKTQKNSSNVLNTSKPVRHPASGNMPEKTRHASKTTTRKPAVLYKKRQTVAPGAFNPNIPVIRDYRHVVVAGETLKSIAKKYGITENELKAVNPGLISAFQGERLRLPVTAKVPGFHPTREELQKARKYESKISGNQVPSSTGRSQQHSYVKKSKPQEFIKHIVKKKETLYSISREYGLKLQDLFEANPGLTVNIKVGQVIRIPKKKISSDFVYYQAMRKTSVKKVAKLYRLDAKSILKVNPSVRRRIYAGQVIRIPVGGIAKILAAEAKKQEMKPVMPSEEEKQQPAPVMAAGRCVARQHNRVFKVAVMVPLYLEETDSINRTEFMMRQEKNFTPFRFIEFLEGSLTASDSLREQGMNLKLYVYDVDQTLTKTAKVLTRPELKNMDLIIGPFYSRSFSQVALFAGHFGIPIVNPLTFRKEILTKYNNVVKVMPDTHEELSQVKHLIANSYLHDKVFVISQTSYKDAEQVYALRDSISQVLPDSVSFPNTDLINLGVAVTQRDKNMEREEKIKQNPLEAADIPKTKVTVNDTLDNYYLENYPVNPEALKTVENDTSFFPNPLIYIDYARDSLHPFEANASVLRDNLVVLYGSSKSFIMDAMNRLNVLRDTFNIKMIGLPEWETIHMLNLYQMDNMKVTWPAGYYVNFDGPAYKKLSASFYLRYATVPNRYGVLGFDITYFFLKSLYQYGKKLLPCLPEHEEQGVSTRFRFKQAGTGENDYENSYWNWLRISGKKLIKLPDSLVGQPYGQRNRQ